MKKICDFLRKMPPKHYLIILMLALTLTALSGVSIYRTLPGFSISPTVIDGFPTYSVSIMGQGNVSISRESIIINDCPNTLTQVSVYSSTNDFSWNFSAIATEHREESSPLIRLSLLPFRAPAWSPPRVAQLCRGLFCEGHHVPICHTL